MNNDNHNNQLYGYLKRETNEISNQSWLRQGNLKRKANIFA